VNVIFPVLQFHFQSTDETLVTEDVICTKKTVNGNLNLANSFSQPNYLFMQSWYIWCTCIQLMMFIS